MKEITKYQYRRCFQYALQSFQILKYLKMFLVSVQYFSFKISYERIDPLNMINLLPVALIMALVSLPAQAVNPDEQASPEQLNQMDNFKKKLEAMTPEEREARKKKMQERKAKWEAMTPEEREARKKKMQERKEKG
jgi:hypothetical protein